MESGFCINCGSAGGSMVLENDQIRHCIQQWTAPRLVEALDLICTACWALAQETVHTSAICRTCVLCNRTLELRTRSHQIISLRTNTPHHVNIRNIILERLAPLEMRASHYICHPCWQKADRAAMHRSTPSSSRATTETMSNPLRCANCGIHLIKQRRHILNNDVILRQIQQQVAPQVVTENDYVCGACHTLFMDRGPTVTPQDSQDTEIVGHQHVCLGCGSSLLRTRSHPIRAEDTHHILDIVQNWIQPREIHTSDSLCHRCFQRAETEAANIVLPDSAVNLDQQHTDRIILPNYSRASDTHRRCIFQHCNSTSQKLVPSVLRVRLFKDHNYYIPPDCRICDLHLARQSWMDLFGVENVNRSFTAAHIEDFCELLKNDNNVLDFENIGQMDDNLVWYWLGRTKEQFRELAAELPEYPKRATSLGAYLMKLRTGDSDDRISSLLNIARSTLTKLMSKAREVLIQHFVPSHLGLQHISREEVASRNLYIPESLFGNPGANLEDRKAIIIMDGTYIYIQKSSNYAYQKKTYSLHKYRNLVKPFMVVCCDGYIIDVLGPYAATKSDADIIKDEFCEPTKPMREYFRSGDVFILDRGFRDSIPLLERLNYKTHYPLSLELGEKQFSTEKANESRKVTMCRWVVEVVNGRFKRDFKLLRQEYCNKAAKHLMHDFKVAAALINKFHPTLEDREDAGHIISIVQEKMFTNNSLADFVEQNSLNKRRAQFECLTVDSQNITEFPQMEYNELILIPLGIYQIKQARSYYAEHVRQDGSYIIEVCKEVDQNVLNNLITSPNTWLLRGKIQSRHISQKTYFVYILIDSTKIGREAIVQYCCNCIVGRRTIGCCAHVMTIIWYLSYGRYHNNNPPAQFLDNILHTNVDNEEINNMN